MAKLASNCGQLGTDCVTLQVEQSGSGQGADAAPVWVEKAGTNDRAAVEAILLLIRRGRTT
jgi:hypothetical protein